MSKEFNWKKYQSDVIKKCVDKYGSREQAMVDWDKIEREIDDEEEAKQAKSA